MTSPAVLEGTRRLDAALPELAAALSAHPPGTAAGESCRVRFVEWTPHRRCQVVQEVRGPDRTTLLAYHVTPIRTTVSGPADDRGLPGLAVALDPAELRDRLGGVCRAPVGACRATPVAHRPGIRAVVAYDVVASDAPARLYAKLLAGGPDRYAAAAAALTDAAQVRGEPAPIPEVVAVWPDLGAVVQREAPGRALSGLLLASSERETLAYAELLGRLLAGVHATCCAAVPVWDAEDELVALETLLAPAWHADPAAGRSLAALVDRLADTVPAVADPVLAHGAFRTGQVVADGGGLTLLDLDTMSLSDRARDAGNAVAYLEWAELRGALPPESAAALHRALAAGYADGGTAWGEQSFAWWCTAAMAKIAGRRFRALVTAEWPRVPDLLRCAAAHLDPGAAVPRPRCAPEDEADASPVERMAQQLGAPATASIRVLEARVLAEAGGRRRVVRYEVDGPDADHPAALIGKTYVDRHRSSLAWANLQAFAAMPDVAVAAPVYHLPALRTVLYREVPGTPLDLLDADLALAAAALAGRWLATLHRSDAVLDRRLDLVHEMAEVAVWALRVGDLVPRARGPGAALAGRLAAAAADLPTGPETPLHKDFHAGHVLLHGVPGAVTVIDLDEARMGDPALDVAHFTAYLDALPGPGAPGVRAAFLTGYGPVPGPSPDERTAFFAAYTSVKIAKQLVTGRGPLAGRSCGDPTDAVIAVLRRGLACLDG